MSKLSVYVETGLRWGYAHVFRAEPANMGHPGSHCPENMWSAETCVTFLFCLDFQLGRNYIPASDGHGCSGRLRSGIADIYHSLLSGQ